MQRGPESPRNMFNAGDTNEGSVRTNTMVRARTVLLALIVCGLALTTLASAETHKGIASVTYPSSFGVSQRLTDLPVDLSLFPDREMPEPLPSALSRHGYRGPSQLDPALQTEALPQVGVTMGVSFDAIAKTGWIPPDNNLAVGPNYIGSIVNTSVAIYSKTGTLLSGPTNIPTIFAAIGGLCGNDYVVDPIVLYDRAADRWVIAGIGLDYVSSYGECVAVSTTNDPTGAYSLYFV